MWSPLSFLFLLSSLLTTTRAENLRRETQESRIVGGVNAVQNRHPYMASLEQTRNRKIHVCGGTLISKNLLLTAAHCDQGAPDKLRVVMNPYSIEAGNEAATTEEFDVIETRVHPDYATPQRWNNDFMLIKIDGESSEKFMRLNKDPDFPVVGGDALAAIGWGTTRYNVEEPPDDGIIQISAKGEYMNNAACDDIYENTVITEDWLCASDDGACQGDSGGPLFVPAANGDPEDDVQVGITSWGIGCGSEKYPGVYARISHGWDWIRINACDMGLGEVPDYFECPGPTSTPSISPTDFPSVSPSRSPSLSQSPTEDGVRITVRLLTDEWPLETSWVLKVATTGAVVAEKNLGDISTKSDYVDELIVLEDGLDYTLTVFDTSGDGTCCRYGMGTIGVYLGANTDSDNMLVEASGEFEYVTTLSFNVPSMSPAPSSTPTDSPEPTGTPTVKGSCPVIPEGGCAICGPGLCVQKPNAVLEFPGQPAAPCSLLESIGLLELPDLAILSEGDCQELPQAVMDVCGCATGTSEPSALPSQSPAPSESPTTTVAPSNAPTQESLGGEVFTVIINTDDWAEETSWSLQSESGEIIFDTLFGDITQENSAVPFEVKLKMTNEYVFAMFDKHGDGNCCRWGNGNATIYYGSEINDDAILLTVEGNFSQAVFVRFIAQDPAIDGPGRVVDGGDAPAWCFPGDVTTQVQGRGPVFMRDVKLGDKVLVGDGTYEPVYSFGHRSAEAVSEYVQLITPSAKLELSGDHMVFVEEKPVPASMVKIGDRLMLADGAQSVVNEVRIVVRKGAYAPFTPSGKVIVNGVQASSFVAFQGTETLSVAGLDTGVTFQFLAHTFEGPHRTWCRYFSACEHEEYSNEGISLWVYVPHKAALWFTSQASPVGMAFMSVPVLAFFLLLAYPLSCLFSVVALLASTRLSLRIKR